MFLNIKLHFTTASLLFSLFIIGPQLLAQNEGNVWYFGSKAGLDFNGSDPLVLTNGQMITFEGCSSIADQDGELLFYTNGVSVWNANHQVMPNGDFLVGNISSTQSSIIVKKPFSASEFYIFTTDDFVLSEGLFYSIVDMDLDNGLGDINEFKNIQILENTAEKVTAIPHANGIDYWILTLLKDSPDFYAYKLGVNGLDTIPVISSIAEVGDINSNSIGYMKSSAQGDRIACANYDQNFVNIFDFNDNTGELQLFTRLNVVQAYGLEFSEDGNLLYTIGWSSTLSLKQYNLNAGSPTQIVNSAYQVGGYSSNSHGAIQMAPDGKIYIAKEYTHYLHRINNPNVIGEGCDFEMNAVDLSPGICNTGLPTFTSAINNQISLKSENHCIGDSTLIFTNYSAYDSIFWYIEDLVNYTYRGNPIEHVFSDTGNFEVAFLAYKNGEVDSSLINIYIFPYPEVFIGEDQELCEGEHLILDAEQENGTYLWQNGSTEAQFTAWNIGDYWVNVTVNECTNSDSIWLYNCDAYVEYPTIFTPNNDGVNDIFEPIYYRDVVNYSIQIYDRWGILMYESSNIDTAWDGTLNSKECSDGVYFYILNYAGTNEKEHQRKGTVTLTRARTR
jgi:gliding motility-associated-like protein